MTSDWGDRGPTQRQTKLWRSKSEGNTANAESLDDLQRRFDEIALLLISQEHVDADPDEIVLLDLLEVLRIGQRDLEDFQHRQNHFGRGRVAPNHTLENALAVRLEECDLDLLVFDLEDRGKQVQNFHTMLIGHRCIQVLQDQLD